MQRVVLDDGSGVACDFAIAAVGININRDLLRGTPIRAETAILVDEHCRTNLEGIYAAGDCAAVFDPLFGKHRLLDHWDNARVTGAIAGTNILTRRGSATFDRCREEGRFVKEIERRGRNPSGRTALPESRQGSEWGGVSS